ncbi:MAG: dihydrofolate reductase [bacterium]|nr:dihydrofolate reductase [bacterium]
MVFSIIAAIENNNGLGFEGQIPWQLSADMRYFKKITTTTNSSSKKNVVIMGRNTWNSLSDKYRPLPDRLNIVLSRHAAEQFSKSTIWTTSLQKALNLVELEYSSAAEQVFVIGGATIYKEALKSVECETLYLTRIMKDIKCDCFFPEYNKEYELLSKSVPAKEGNLKYIFEIYKRK